ncbi:alpha/beta fold hydrolase [Actinoplanes sp. NEAU-A12]|uniref:Alpha/beta fold hydrolase n=1 Tax=Actinoplanes sandaracinus TaxID=3045177 RepID=A0ABT6WC33_9ACTN|nr:alpha/beta fold hydrolase [Actinoplanes sandaracinus]MDI6097269.1 alpha/beta fold hydrolase [Actinoplanes sandaracinus]
MTQPAPLVLVSSAMGIGSRYYRPLAEAFRARGWDARALPRRGFEPDSPPASRGHDWSYGDEVDEMARAVAAARAEAPDRPVILLGHSLGAQLAVGHQHSHPPADGLVTVGGCLPFHRDYPRGGPHLLIMGSLIVPVLTGLFGFLPKPAFGGPGARTLMREWARMARTGRTPFPSATPITTPSLVVALEGDRLAPEIAVKRFAARLVAPQSLTTWLYRDADVPPGASNDHTSWARHPGPVVDRVLTWWTTVAEGRRPSAAARLDHAATSGDPRDGA